MPTVGRGGSSLKMQSLKHLAWRASSRRTSASAVSGCAPSVTAALRCSADTSQSVRACSQACSRTKWMYREADSSIGWVYRSRRRRSSGAHATRTGSSTSVSQRAFR